MSTPMIAGSPVIEAITLAYNSNLPVLLEGSHGIGKSQITEQAAKALGIRCIVRDLSLMEPPDLIGLPEKRGDWTRYLTPEFLPRDGRGLLVFEELNRAEKYMMSPCLQLLTARCLNDYRLPDGWLPVAAINPAADGYDANELDPALLSRFLRIRMKASTREWLKWADGNGVHDAVRRHVEGTHDIFESSNPRSWTYVSDLLKTYEKGGKTDRPLLAKMIGGLVGDTHAVAFMATCRGAAADMPTTDDILRNYKHAGKTIQKWKSKAVTDKLTACAHAMRTALQDADLSAEIAGSNTMKKALADFIKDLPADLGKEVKADAKAKGIMK